MKSKKILFLEKVLRFMAVVVLKRHKPKIVAISGSVGKTSARTAVFAVLSSKYRVRENQKNYNNEIGIPLTIIGSESGGKSLLKWTWVFLKWIAALAYPKYPEILVFELGVDRQNDMRYFMSFIRPLVGIITNVSLSHIEFFKTVENIAKEKKVLIESLPADGFAILNADDRHAVQMGQDTAAQAMTFGLAENSTVNASHVMYNYQEGKLEGISFKLNYDGANIPIRLRNILAPHHIYAALAAAAVGIVFKINLVDIAKALEFLESPAGRMNLLAGLRGSSVIDDTYNASPLSVVSALDVLGQLKAERKIAVLGDMLELGDRTEAEHREIGRKIFSSKTDIFVAVGWHMKQAADQLAEIGFLSSKILYFDDPMSAAIRVAQIAKAGDLILVKGSQGMRMEKIVEKLLADPAQAENLLCRQSRDWKKKPFVKP